MSKALRFLYENRVGRVLLKGLTLPCLSKAAGAFLDTKASCVLIPHFMKQAGIVPSEYEDPSWKSFNACFSRKIKPKMRPIDQDPKTMIAPCDGNLTVWPIREGTVLPVKQSSYTIKELVNNEKIARLFDGGYAFVFRLCVENYHRYAYVDSGRCSTNVTIPGKLHTVRPIALHHEPVFVQNARQYQLIRSDHFGPMLQMEVGAMLVGKIVNEAPQMHDIVRGEEKGYFQYGGSTVIVLTAKDAVVPKPALINSSRLGSLIEEPLEIPVKMGEAVGYKK